MTSPVVQDLELVTVTDTSFVLTWFTGDRARQFGHDPGPDPVPTDSVVRYGTSPERLDREVSVDGTTAYHHVEVGGLRPGTTYWYEARSAGQPAQPRVLPLLDYDSLAGIDRSEAMSPDRLQELAMRLLGTGATVMASPGRVTTLVPPPGRLLLTVALSNDLHIGEEVSGLVAGDFPPGFSQSVGHDPYPVVMARALVADVARRGAEILVVAGDVSSAARPAELTASRSLLDAFGSLGGSPCRQGGGPGPMYLVARGNHDQPHGGPAYAEGATVPGHPDRHDTVPGAYSLARGQLRVAEVGGLRLVGLDTTTVDTAGGAIDAAQFSELEAVLRASPTQPTVVFGHHPVTDESARTAIAGPSFVLDRADAARLQDLYSSTPGVFFHHAGHTHRNLRTRSPVATGVEFLEVAAVKEYPGGYSLLRIYEGGYTVNFHKSSAPDALRWSQLTSGQYLGLYPAYTLGSLEDRNHVVLRHFSVGT